MSNQSQGEQGSNGASHEVSPAGRIALKVSALHADLLNSLHEEIGTNGESFADAAQRLAGEFGAVTAAAVEAAQGVEGRRVGLGAG